MEMEFWGAVIPPGKTLKVDVDESDEYVHVTQVALDADAKSGRCALTIRVGDGDERVLCTLEKGRCDQAGLDVVVDATFALRNVGSNPLHLTGLRQTDGIDLAEEDDEIERLAAMKAMEDTDEDDDSDDNDSDSDDGEAANVLSQLVDMFKKKNGRDPTEEDMEEWAKTLREAAEADGKLSAQADDVLGQLVEMFKEEHGREPSEAEMAQWAKTLKEAADDDDDDDDDVSDDDDQENDDEDEEGDLVFGIDDLPKEKEVDYGASDEEDSDLDDIEAEEGLVIERVDTKATSASKGKVPKPHSEPEEKDDESESASDDEDTEDEDGDSDDDDDDDDEDESESDEEDEKGKPPAADAEAGTDSESESDEDDDDSESEDEDVGDDDSDKESDSDSGSEDSDSEDDEVEDEEEKERPAMASPSSGAKRAAANPVANPTSVKKQKTDAPATPVVKAFEAYADELAAFLEKHPKTHMAALGGKVKRPKNMMMKVKEFLRMHKDRFKIEGDFVSNV